MFKWVWFPAVLIFFAVLFVSGCATKQESVVEQSTEREVQTASAADTGTQQAAASESESVSEEQTARPADEDADGVPDDQDRCLGTPAGMRVDERGCPADDQQQAAAKPAYTGSEEMSYRVTLLFDIDSAALRMEYDRLRREAEQYMKENPDSVLESVLIDGHADSTGTETHNLILSRRRAQAVRNYMVENLGVDSDLITVRAFGESYPVASNRTSTGRQKNRRVVVTFHGSM